MKRTICVWFLAVVANSAALPATIDFNRDVRPILSDKCFFCHGPDKEERKAKLRLDQRASAMKVLDEIVPRLEETDPEEIMPPPESHKTLSAAEIAILKRWVAAGAPYAGQWIYEKPVRDANLGPNAIDHFVQARLKQSDLKAAPEAGRVALLRRVSFDLTGLPPTRAEVEAFLADTSEGAYGRVVARLLSSQAFGERMASKWLDLVRYADTVGFHGDQNVSQSPYRDYVIDAFNDNMPYDQFTREQLAGDLLPNATLWQKVASGYNRLNMTTEEGGAQAKEYLAKYAGDRVRNVSGVWMGATLGCAECHDHKYDPYTSKDFYAFAAFFAGLQEVGKYGARKRPPEIPVPPKAAEARAAELDAEIAKLKEILDTETPELTAARTEWAASKKKGAEPIPEDRYFIEERAKRGDKADGWKYAEKGTAPVHRGAISREQSGAGIVQHILYFKDHYTASADDVFFGYVYLDPKNPPKAVMLQFRQPGSWDHRAYWGEDKIAYGGIGKDTVAHKRMGSLPKAGGWVRLEASAKAVGINLKQKLEGMAFTQFEGKAWWDDAGVATTSGGVPRDIAKVLLLERPNADQEARLASYYRSIAPALSKTRAEVAAKQTERGSLMGKVPTMPISVSQAPRMMRVLARGNWMDESGEEVQPAIPAFLGKVQAEGERASRMDLANWLVSRDNPMTARVFVNHLWHMMFGSGISNVLSDLGNQGEPPSHGELLDWLAVEFVDSGWDVKHMLTLIAQSHAYKQSSKPTADLGVVDPYNRLLSRHSPRRLTAEMVRDNSLAVSGLLVRQVGGVSVRPYQPAGYYAQLNFPRRAYAHSTDENQWRRAVYSHWQRTFLHPAMMAFDAPSREACTAQRPVSNTPLQALVLMNDPSFVEAARTFAERIVSEGGEDRIGWAVQEVLSRPATAQENEILQTVYTRHRAEFAADTDAAKALSTVGQRPASKGDASELAAWTSVARVILNLHETITRY
jgi:hypothetical protein